MNKPCQKSDAELRLSPSQEKEAMEAAVRAFEDWEFRVLERESGIDEEEEESTAEQAKEGESDGGMEREIACQQQAVNSAQVRKPSQLLPDSGSAARQRVTCSVFTLTHVCLCSRTFLPTDVTLVHRDGPSGSIHT